MSKAKRLKQRWAGISRRIGPGVITGSGWRRGTGWREQLGQAQRQAGEYFGGFDFDSYDFGGVGASGTIAATQPVHNRLFFMRRKPLQIAIDGPIGSGKSVVAAEVARRLGIFLVDAGALYRTTALIAIRHKIQPDKAAQAALFFRRAKVVLRQPRGKEADGRKITVVLDGEDVSRLIRTHEIDDLVAKFGEHKEVIEEVHEKERKLAIRQDVVIEGREIGTEVLPAAQVKVYLTADIKTRVKRRFTEYERRGNHVARSEIARALKERDELDMRRAYAPLRKAGDSVLIDTTDKTVDQVVEQIIRLVPKDCQYKLKTQSSKFKTTA